MVSLKHKFHSSKTDSSDASIVRPSNWNDEHDLLMAGNRLMGRAVTGTGPAGEISLASALQFAGTTLDLSDSMKTDITGKANKASLVQEQPDITGALPGATYIAIFNQGDNKSGRIPLSDLKTKGDIASSKTKVIGGAGLGNAGGQEELSADVTINMHVPGTLNATTPNAAPENDGHTHSIQVGDVVRTGTSELDPGQLGSYILARQTSGTAKVMGETISGANLQGAASTQGGGAGSMSGTWVCSGRVIDTTNNNGMAITLWCRRA